MVAFVFALAQVCVLVVGLHVAIRVESEKPRERPRLILKKRTVPTPDAAAAGAARESTGSVGSGYLGGTERVSLESATERASVTSLTSLDSDLTPPGERASGGVDRRTTP